MVLEHITGAITRAVSHGGSTSRIDTQQAYTLSSLDCGANVGTAFMYSLPATWPPSLKPAATPPDGQLPAGR